MANLRKPLFPRVPSLLHPEPERNLEDVADFLHSLGTWARRLEKRINAVLPEEVAQLVLSDDNPQAPGTAAAGTSSEISRADHVHPQQTVVSWSLVETQTVTEEHAALKDTGIDLPSSVGNNDIFLIVVRDLSTPGYSGSTITTGKELKNLPASSEDDQESDSNCIAFDQGDNTDDEYFIGRTSSNDILISSDVDTSNNLEIWVYRLPMS